MKQKIKYKLLVLAGILVIGATMPPNFSTKATECPDVRIVFARGSGGERWVDKNYLEFKNTIDARLKTVDLKYEFVDLDYPAVGVGIENLGVTIGAYVGRGEVYEFGKSVKIGVDNLVRMVNEDRCVNTKYVLGGYSQGAMVISRAIKSLKPERVVYATTFGDPKIYLPEGKGLFPKACSGKGLSEWRIYVPDCRAYKGKLGANEPYAPAGFEGKVGTWCNGRDFFCSSGVSMSNHTSYIESALYNDASKIIFSKICETFGIKARVATMRDTAILIDSTGSMGPMINKYKSEALRLAQETFAAGGRVALYDYRDLSDPYKPNEHCNFDTCTLEIFKNGLNSIRTTGGGDNDESLLSASLTAMKSLKWQFGATKSMVVLTDAPFLLPDRDGVTLDEVVRLSKEIDPVNFYIITEPSVAPRYEELATRTDGLVFTDFGKLNLLTDYIMERFDSLPRVEEVSSFTEELPSVEVISSEPVSGEEYLVKFKTDAKKVVVALNDWILGESYESEVVIGGLDLKSENTLTLIPISGETSGESVNVLLSSGVGFGADGFVPKAPNTGRLF